MAAGHGGARPGAGRKAKKAATPGVAVAVAVAEFSDPLDYLIAVARGLVPGDSLRVAAAKAALPFVTPKARVPVESPPPQAIRARAERSADAAAVEDWKRRAAAVRARIAKGKT